MIPSVKARGAIRHVVVLGAFAVVTTLWLLPLVTHLGTSVSVEPSDATAGMRFYWAAEQQGETPFTLRHDRLLDAPEGTDATPAIQVANAIQPAFVWATKGLLGYVAALNLFMLAGFVLAGFFTFLLLDRLGLHPVASVFGAYVYAFNPYMFSKLAAGHAGLLHTWIFPLIAFLFVRLRRRPTRGAAVLAGLGVAVAFYLHSYHGLFALVLAGVFVAVDLVRAPSRSERFRSFRLATIALGAALLGLLPALVTAIRNPDAVASSEHPLEALQLFGARIPAYLLPAEANPLLGRLVGEDTRRTLTESGSPTLFFGYTTIALALAGVVLLVRRHPVFSDPNRRYLGISAAVLIPVAFVMSLPRTFHGVPMPSYLIGEATTTIRVYSRLGILVGLGLVVLAAFALDALLRSHRRGTLLAAGAIALVGVELANELPAPIWRTDRPPAYDRWLATQPSGIVAFYPSPGDQKAEERFVREQTFFQIVHGQPLFFSGSPRKNRAWAIRALADHAEDELTAGILAAEGVRYVIVDPSVYSATVGEGAPTIPPAYYRELAVIGDARVYSVIAPPIDLDRALRENSARVAAAIGVPVPGVRISGSGFEDEERAADGSQSRWMIQDGFVEVDNRTPGAELELAAEGFSAHRPRRLELIAGDGSVLATTEVPTASTKLRLGPFRLPKGKHTLRIRATPGPERLGGDDPREVTVYFSPIAVRPVADFSNR